MKSSDFPAARYLWPGETLFPMRSTVDGSGFSENPPARAPNVLNRGGERTGGERRESWGPVERSGPRKLKDMVTQGLGASVTGNISPYFLGIFICGHPFSSEWFSVASVIEGCICEMAAGLAASLHFGTPPVPTSFPLVSQLRPPWAVTQATPLLGAPTKSHNRHDLCKSRLLCQFDAKGATEGSHEG